MKSFLGAIALGLCSCLISEAADHVSISGEVFTEDHSLPSLGEAYRDPGDLVWGSPLREADGKVKKLSQYAASAACRSLGARLPTKPEFERLRFFLSKDYSGEGVRTYSPYERSTLERGGNLEVLPELSGNFSPGNHYWSEAKDAGYSDAYVFVGRSGIIYGDDRPRDIINARCVAGQPPLTEACQKFGDDLARHVEKKLVPCEMAERRYSQGSVNYPDAVNCGTRKYCR